MARLTRMAGGGATRARGAERNRGEGEGEADVWARLGISFFCSFFFFLGRDSCSLELGRRRLSSPTSPPQPVALVLAERTREKMCSSG